MLWNTFDTDIEKIDRFHHPRFEEGSGLADFEEIQEALRVRELSLAGEDSEVSFAKLLIFVYENAAIEVNPVDWFGIGIAGWEPDCRRLPWRVMGRIIRARELAVYGESEEGKAIAALRNLHSRTGAGWSYPDNCHSKPYWEDVLALGIPGLLARVKKVRDETERAGGYTEEKRCFYESVIAVYEALIRLLGRFAACAARHEREGEKAKYLREALEALAVRPPETFYEGLLVIYFYLTAQEYVGGVQVRTLGNLDTLLRPYYERDLAAGTLTRDQAKELIKYFYMQFAYAGNINGQPVYFAGTGEHGEDLVNDLSYLFIEAYGELNIVSPKVQIAVSEKTPDDFLRKCLALVREGHSSFAFANEDLARRSMRLFTDREEDMRTLSLSGCYNFSLKEDIQPESAGISLVKGVELTLYDGVDPLTGLPLGIQTCEEAALGTFERFYEAYLAQTFKLVDDAVAITEFYDKNFRRISLAPMLSATFGYTVNKGKDVYCGGSKYHNSVITVSCLATAVDSLYAVKKYVYDEKRLTLSQLKAALAANWEGYEDLRREIASDREKYGNNLPAVDFYARDLMKRVGAYILSKKTIYGDRYAPDGEGIDHGIAFGKATGATPDGRFAHDQLSKNLQAVFGCDRRGILAYLHSATSVDAFDFPNGAPIDFVLHPSAAAGDEGLDVMLSLLRTTFAKGGAALQGNVCDAALLRDAKAHPENYKGLQVRLCGWSQYFNKLTADEQDMLIRQAETA